MDGRRFDRITNSFGFSENQSPLASRTIFDVHLRTRQLQPLVHQLAHLLYFMPAALHVAKHPADNMFHQHRPTTQGAGYTESHQF